MCKRTGVLAALCLMLLATACQHEDPSTAERSGPPSPTATPSSESAASEKAGRPADQPVFDLDRLAALSSGQMDAVGVNRDLLLTLPAMYRLKNLRHAIVKYDHWAYEQDFFNDVLHSEGYLALLGFENGEYIALSIRAGIDFEYPRYGYWDPEEGDGIPDFITGVLALSAPDDPSGGKDYYIVDREHNKDRIAQYMQKDSQLNRELQSSFLPKVGISPATWQQILDIDERVKFDALGSNDLGFLRFSTKRSLGITAQSTSGEVIVSTVKQGSTAEAAGIRPGDKITKLAGRPVGSLNVLRQALLAQPYGQEFELSVVRQQREIKMTAVFGGSSNFFADGRVIPIGVPKPRTVVDELLKAQATIGSLLNTEIFARSSLSNELEQRAELQRKKSLAEVVLSFLPGVAGLLGASCELALKLYKTSSRLEGFIAGANWCWKMFQDGKQALDYFEKQFSVEEPLVYQARSLRVVGGNRIEVINGPEKGTILQLAYLEAPDEASKSFLDGFLQQAQKEHWVIWAMPDGRDRQGIQHCHILALPASGDSLTWLNLILVTEGGAIVRDSRVSDGRSTHMLLEGLRSAEKRR
jgi:hypothetical protein